MATNDRVQVNDVRVNHKISGKVKSRCNAGSKLVNGDKGSSEKEKDKKSKHNYGTRLSKRNQEKVGSDEKRGVRETNWGPRYSERLRKKQKKN